MQNGVVVGQEGQNGFALTSSWDIESGSKSFCGVIALQLIADGLITSLDAKVADVITEWQGVSAQKDACTVRRLLCLTSGLAPGATGSNPTYQTSINALMPIAQVGKFRYGPNPFGVFGMYVNRLVQPLGFADAVDYLRQKVLTPAGITVASWDYVAAGQPHLAGGAHLACPEWAKYGEYLRNTDITVLTAAGPDYAAYGVNFWRWFGDSAKLIAGDLTGSQPMLGNGYMAAGANNQRLVIIPDKGIVCARFGVADATWSDAAFVGLLFQ